MTLPYGLIACFVTEGHPMALVYHLMFVTILLSAMPTNYNLDTLYEDREIIEIFLYV